MDEKQQNHFFQLAVSIGKALACHIEVVKCNKVKVS